MLKGFKPCPFCGMVSHLSVSNREMFERVVNVSGYFCLSVECQECSTEMYVFNETDYDEAVEHLRDKWNRREQ